MRHLTSHRVFLDGIRLWQASASLTGLGRRSGVGSGVHAGVPSAKNVSFSSEPGLSPASSDC